MPAQLDPLPERIARSRAIAAVHASWADRQIAAGVDGPTPAGRKEPSDYNLHVPDMEADGAALDEFAASVGRALEATP